jgi:hypothetical protein
MERPVLRVVLQTRIGGSPSSLTSSWVSEGLAHQGMCPLVRRPLRGGCHHLFVPLVRAFTLLKVGTDNCWHSLFRHPRAFRLALLGCFRLWLMHFYYQSAEWMAVQEVVLILSDQQHFAGAVLVLPRVHLFEALEHLTPIVVYCDEQTVAQLQYYSSMYAPFQIVAHRKEGKNQCFLLSGPYPPTFLDVYGPGSIFWAPEYRSD